MADVKVTPKQLGKNTRMSFGKINEVLEMPNLIEVQKNSYQWFVDKGLKEVFDDMSAITDYTGNLVLDFVDYRIDKEPKYDVAECKERDVTYAAPLRVKARLFNKETGEIKEQEIFMEAMDLAQTAPSLSQAQRMKKLSRDGKLNDDTMLDIMMEQKKPEGYNVVLSADKLRKYFPRSYTPQKMEETILKLLDAWLRKRQRDQSR